MAKGDCMRKVRINGVRAMFDEKRMTLDFELGEENIVLYAHYEVCGACDGRGTTTRHIECDGGGFTGSEWAEMCDGDPDFAEDYFSGRYDRDCPDCDGRRVVPVPNDNNDQAMLKTLENWIYEEQCYRAEVEAERRMGA